MILSKRHKFVYLKGQKVASTSVELALSAICGDEDIITLMDPIDERRRMELGIRPAQNFAASREVEVAYLERLRTADPAIINDLERPESPYRPHMSFSKLTKVYGPLDDFFIFGVDRNPYAKVISLANMRQSYRGSYRQGGEMRASEEKLGKALARVLRGGLTRIDNLKRYSDNSGRLRARVLRYENLEEELAALVVERGWPTLPALPHAKKGIAANDRDVRETLTPEQIAQVNELLALDFQVNSYERFDPSPRRQLDLCL